MRATGVRNESEPLKPELDDERRGCHRQVERSENEPHHSRAVVLSVNVENRQHDEIGEDERDYAAEADSAVPEHRRTRNVADRADKRENRDDRSNDRSPEECPERMR